MSNLKHTELHDPEGDTLIVERLAESVPARLDLTSEGWVYLRTSKNGAYINVGELLSAIEKATGVSRSIGSVHVNITGDMDARALGEDIAFAMRGATDPTPAPEPLWTEVRERPARAVKVTPELVRRLADSGQDQAELDGLGPAFSQGTGAPVGVGFYDPRRFETTSVPLGKYVVLRPGQLPQVMLEDEFEATYQAVEA